MVRDRPAAVDVDPLELQHVATLGWPGLEAQVRDGWLLRAGAGWTGRANSALPLGTAVGDLDTRLDLVRRWYDARGLAPLIQLPLPSCDELRARLVSRGWSRRWSVLVMVADVDAVLARAPRRDDLTPVRVAPVPDDAWLSTYHYRGGASLPDGAVEVLCAGANVRFLSIAESGVTIAICRMSLARGWVGITAVEVDAAHRRRGLATHLLVAALDRAAAWGARHVYLQTDVDNGPAQQLYARAGFVVHHEYTYLGPPNGDRG